MTKRLGSSNFISALPYVSLFVNTEPKTDLKTLSVSKELTKTKEHLCKASKTTYEDPAIIRSISRTSTSESTNSGSSNTTDDSVSDAGSGEEENLASVEISSNPLRSDIDNEVDSEWYSGDDDSIKDYSEASNDQSSEDECEKCGEIRTFYRKEFAKLREQYEAVLAENKALIEEMQLNDSAVDASIH